LARCRTRNGHPAGTPHHLTRITRAQACITRPNPARLHNHKAQAAPPSHPQQATARRHHPPVPSPCDRLHVATGNRRRHRYLEQEEPERVYPEAGKGGRVPSGEQAETASPCPVTVPTPMWASGSRSEIRGVSRTHQKAYILDCNLATTATCRGPRRQRPPRRERSGTRAGRDTRHGR